MKKPSHLKITAILASVSLLFLAACGKKESSPAPADAAQAAAEDSKKAETSMADAAAQLASSEAAEKAANQAQAAAEKAEAAAADAQKKAEAAAEKAQADAAAVKAEADAAVAEAQAQAESIQKQAAEMLAKYSAEIDSLKAQASKLDGLIEKNADMLPDGVADKYSEFKELVPELSSMVNSLKDYQGTDLENIVSKIQTDYSQAEGLYKEIMAMIPTGVSMPSVKTP